MFSLKKIKIGLNKQLSIEIVELIFSVDRLIQQLPHAKCQNTLFVHTL